MKFKLHHISIYSNKIRKLKNFYSSLFNFKNIHTFKNKKGGVYGYFLYINKSNFIEILKSQKKIKNNNNFNFFLILQKNFFTFYKKCKKAKILLDNIPPQRGRTDKVLHFKIIDY